MPHSAQTVWGSFGARQRSHATNVGAVAFHCERRDRVLLRDIFRFGTATVVPFVSPAEAGQGWISEPTGGQSKATAHTIGK